MDAASLGGKRGKRSVCAESCVRIGTFMHTILHYSNCCRYSCVIKDNVITHFNLDSGLSCALADPTLEQLKQVE